MNLESLQNYVYAIDPFLLNHNPPVDRQRLMRALSIKIQTGISIREFQNNAKPPLTFDKCHVVSIVPELSVLHDRMKQRIESMLTLGVLNEIKDFWKQIPVDDCPLKKTVGLMPLTQYLEGAMTLDNALMLAFIQTRQYAKRQLTWLKGQGIKDAMLNPECDLLLEIVDQ